VTTHIREEERSTSHQLQWRGIIKKGQRGRGKRLLLCIEREDPLILSEKRKKIATLNWTGRNKLKEKEEGVRFSGRRERASAGLYVQGKKRHVFSRRNAGNH